jgi:hypothetical protein
MPQLEQTVSRPPNEVVPGLQGKQADPIPMEPSGQIPLEPESYERIGYLNDTYSVAMDLTMWLMNTTTPSTLSSLINISFQNTHTYLG